ncbi:MliC family protein [Chromobacterium sp. LK11]|uniref:MliC family protein n=1 Tax=Chromobacterium sp. LK11 TaxID=1628212 RepID=UPI000B1B6931|nr:MliC family protein [Chromobacterium sp. LK11]
MKSLLFAALTLSSAVALAKPLSLPEIQAGQRQVVNYVCAGGAKLTVKYYNVKNGQSFAVLPIEGKTMLLANVVSGSGAKYAAEQYSWWTKGPEGALRNENSDKALLDDCKESRR